MSKQSIINSADEMLNSRFEEYNVPIELFTLTEIDDNQGGVVTSWVTFATVDAFIFPMTGSEKIQNGRLISDQMFKVHLKPLAGINEKMKLTYEGEDYQIRSIENIASNDIWLKLTVEKGVIQ